MMMNTKKKGFGEKKSLNHPPTEIFKTHEDFVSDCFELTIICIKNGWLDTREMISFATDLDGDQLGDNNQTDAMVKSLISQGCDPRVASKLGIILTYLEISKLTNQINKKFDRREQTDFNTARTIATAIDCFMLYNEDEDGDISYDFNKYANYSQAQINQSIINRLKAAKKAMLKSLLQTSSA
jgi:hypothetical protein